LQYNLVVQKLYALAGILSLGLCTCALGQIKPTRVALKDALSKALAIDSLTGAGSRPFHIRVIVSEAENLQSPYQGSIEEWWSSPTKWRREVTAKGGIRQTIVVADGRKSEQDEGDYFPLWLRSFVTALFDPVPNVSAWTASGLTIEETQLPNVYKSDTCERTRSKIGTGNRATDAFSTICFDGKGRLSSVVSPRYSMSFNRYQKFGEKQIPFAMGDVPESGTVIGGDLIQLEDLSNAISDDLFTPLPSNDSRFDSIELSAAKLEELTSGNPPIIWPAVRSGNLRGNLAMYVSIDAQGHVREAWPLNSDNAGLDDAARDQVKKWTIIPVKDSAGNPVQVDGALGFRFESVIANPIPVLSDAEARQLAIKTVEPELAPGIVPGGTRYRVRIAVNEHGVVTGIAGGDTEVPGTIKASEPYIFPIMIAVREWHFRPLIKDGAPQSFFAELVFAIR
jgi:hypothetical protein